MSYDLAKEDPYDLTKDFRMENCVYCDSYESCLSNGNSHLSPLFCPNFFLESTCKTDYSPIDWELY